MTSYNLYKPKEINEPIQLAASKVNLPLAKGESSDRRMSNDGDIHPTEHPWANTIMFAEIIVYKVEIFDLTL